MQSLQHGPERLLVRVGLLALGNGRVERRRANRALDQLPVDLQHDVVPLYGHMVHSGRLLGVEGRRRSLLLHLGLSRKPHLLLLTRLTLLLGLTLLRLTLTHVEIHLWRHAHLTLLLTHTLLLLLGWLLLLLARLLLTLLTLTLLLLLLLLLAGIHHLPLPVSLTLVAGLLLVPNVHVHGVEVNAAAHQEL